MSHQIQILNGPNLNLLGRRQPEIYGTATLADIEQECKAVSSELGLSCSFHQTNHEGELVELIHNSLDSSVGIVINAGAYTHTSVALHDALSLYTGFILEVHISNIYAREEFRHHSYVSPHATGVIAGFGIEGYVLALHRLSTLLST